MESVIVQTSLDDIKSYLTSTLVTDRSLILPAKFQEETFDFYGRILSGAKEMAGPLEALHGFDRQFLTGRAGKAIRRKNARRRGCEAHA